MKRFLVTGEKKLFLIKSESADFNEKQEQFGKLAKKLAFEIK
jgi:hypothetical protein